MKYFMFFLIYNFAMITYIIGYTILRKGIRKNRIDRVYFMAAMLSAGWSLCMALVLVQPDHGRAAVLRALGMLHIFGLLICNTHMMLYWSNVQGRLKRWTVGFIWLGVLLYPFMILPGNVTFTMTTYGMSYRLTSGILSAVYAAYCAIAACNMACVAFYMLRSSIRRRDRVVAYSLLLCISVVCFGCVVDTAMQMVGYAAFPGSTIGQFFGCAVLYRTYRFYNKTRMTLENMSEFVYYSVDEPVFVFDEAERLCIVNNGATLFLGVSAEECSKLKLSDVFELNRNAFRFRGNKNRVEARCWQRNNICSITIDKIYDDYRDIIGYIVIVHDVTERVRMLERVGMEKQRADKANEAKSVFLANMSHEIRTPINAVMGMNEMILRESEDAAILEYAGNIRDASKTLLVLINDILDFSKIESGMMEVVEQAYSLRALLKALRVECGMRAKEKGLRLTFAAPEDTPDELLGDEVRVRQIVLNILTNAVKYTEKGSVTLRVSYQWTQADQIELTFAVQDTGIGIKEENIGRLFDQFDRINEEEVHAIEGTGLGLSIVDRLVRLMHGSVQVESVFGEGSTFTVRLPQKVVGDAKVGSLEESARQAGSRKGLPMFTAPEAKVLAVDDNKVNLTVLRGLLRKTKVQLTLAQSGRECLKCVAQERYDVILLDHMMPGMDGIETLAAMRAMPENKSREAAVIALTANAMAGVREMYLEKGFDDYLAKPIESTSLEELLMRYLPAAYIRKAD